MTPERIAELRALINAACSPHGSDAYLAYMRMDTTLEQEALSDLPELLDDASRLNAVAKEVGWPGDDQNGLEEFIEGVLAAWDGSRRMLEEYQVRCSDLESELAHIRLSNEDHARQIGGVIQTAIDNATWPLDARIVSAERSLSACRDAVDDVTSFDCAWNERMADLPTRIRAIGTRIAEAGQRLGEAIARAEAAERERDNLDENLAIATHIIKRLVVAMRMWGSWEDGVPAPDAFGKHREAGTAFDDAVKYLEGK